MNPFSRAWWWAHRFRNNWQRVMALQASACGTLDLVVPMAMKVEAISDFYVHVSVGKDKFSLRPGDVLIMSRRLQFDALAHNTQEPKVRVVNAEGDSK